MRSGDWKLLHKGGKINRKPTSGIVNRTSLLNKTCLFNLKDDPSENLNVIEDYPEVARRLKKTYAHWSKEVAGGRQRAN